MSLSIVVPTVWFGTVPSASPKLRYVICRVQAGWLAALRLSPSACRYGLAVLYEQDSESRPLQCSQGRI
jgi:hypothetical protein